MTSNVFRVVGASIDRVEMADTSFAALNYQSFRNVTFADNTFHGISQPTISPLLIEHVQNTAADTWVVDGAAYDGALIVVSAVLWVKRHQAHLRALGATPLAVGQSVRPCVP